jgi:hypothetical protein
MYPECVAMALENGKHILFIPANGGKAAVRLPLQFKDELQECDNKGRA